MAAESAVRIIFLGDSAQAVRSVSKLESSFGTLGRTAKLATAAVGIAMVGALAGATSAAIDFDRSMRNVNSIAKLSEKQFQDLSKQVLALGKSTGQTPKVLADGLYDIVSSGFKANAAIKILAVSAKAATAGMTNTATASKAVVAVLNAYHMSADKAKNVSSLLFTEVNKGVNTFEELATNIGDTAPLAASLKIPFSDVSAGLALITLHGTSMAEAATQMSRVMADLLKPSKGLSAELKNLGYENGQAAIQAHGFIPLIAQLSKAADGSSAKTAEWFQNIRSLRGMLNLTGPNLHKFNQFADEMAQSFEKGGADVAAFNEQAKSISVQWAMAKSAIIAAAIPIGQLLFPALTAVMGAAADAATHFSHFIGVVRSAPDLSAKFKVIGEGAKNMAKAIVDSIKKALFGFETMANPTGIHPDKMAVTFHDGLVQSLAKLDWAAIGAKIGEGIVGGIKVTGAFAQKVVGAIGDALAKVNWDELARKAGPLIVTALASAISAATDPSFWIHHWDLALSVALVAFGGSVGRIAGRLGALLLKPFAELAPRMGRVIGDLVLAVAERLPRALQRVFLNAAVLAGRALQGLAKAAASVGEDIVAFIRARVAKIPGLLRFTLKVLGVDAAIHAIGQLASYIVAKIGQAIHWITGEFSKLPGVIKSAFDVGPIGAMIDAVQTLIGVVHTLIGWISKIHFPSPPGYHSREIAPGPIGPKGGMASGGFIPGQTGSPQMILAHAGEVILNPMQQAAFGGAAFFKQTFGFSEGGSSFAAGGIVGHRPKRRHGSKSPHSHRHHRNPVKAKSQAAKAILKVLEEVDENEGNADRAYGQLVRQFDITQETFIRTDPASGQDYLSKPDIDQRVSEIDQLITARNNYLALLDEEKAELEKAIKKLKAAIAALVKAIKQEREQAAQDADAIRSLGAQLGHTKDPKAQARIQNQITARDNSRSKHLSNVGTLQGSLGDFKTSLADVQENLGDTLPMDVRDVGLDISTLQAERKDVVGTTLPASGAIGGGGGGGAGGDQGAEITALLAQIARLNLALGIQGAQSAIIGSFAKGTLSVPETGLALVHAGEQITPAGQVRSGTVAAPSPPHIEIHFEKGLEWLEGHTKVIVDGQIAELGRAANARARSGRT